MAGKKTGKRLLTWVLVLVMALSLLPLNALATDGPETGGGSGMNFKKELVSTTPDDDDGTYTIRMTAQATGTTTTTSKAVPMDIVLVLDVSGSMDEYIPARFEKVENVDKSKTYYVQYPYEFLFWKWTRYREVEWCDGCQAFVRKSLCIDAGPFGHYNLGKEFHENEDTFYTKIDEVQKLAALKTAVNGFIDQVAQNSADSSIAVVSFASEATNVSGGLLPVKTDANALKVAVNNLSADGATRADSGMQEAASILKDGTNEKKVVIMFTDGEPTKRSEFSDTVANDTISAAKGMKDKGTEVFTVGVFDSDPDNKTHAYMNYVSSNYPQAQNMRNPGVGSDKGYYTTADSADSLSKVFEDISQTITKPAPVNDKLDEKTVITDTLSDYFTFAGTADDVKVSAIDANGNKKDSADAANAKATPNGKTVTVTGYDFSKHHTESNDPEELVIEIKVKPDTSYTNWGMSGEYETNEGIATVTLPNIEKPIAEAASPKVHVDTYQVTYGFDNTAPDDATPPEDDRYYISGQQADVKQPEESSVNAGGNTYTFEGWKNGEANVGEKIDISGNVTLTGSWSKTPNTASYTVNYLWNGTSIKDSTTDTAAYGDTVNVTAPSIEGYTLIPKQKMSIEIGAGENVLNLNYYKNVTLTANSGSVTYNGKEHTVTGYTSAPEGVSFDSVTATGSGTNAGKYDVKFSENAVGTHNELYIVTAANPGKLEITPRKVTLTSETASKPYDGTPLTKPEVTVTGDGFVKGEVTDIRATGSVTNVSDGEVTNTIEYTTTDNFKAGNYTITKTEGKLKITEAPTYNFNLTDLGITVYKEFKSMYGLGAEKSFTATVTIEKETYTAEVDPDFPSNRSAATAEPTYYEATGTVTLKTGKTTKAFDFGKENKFQLEPGTYHITVKETNDGDRYVTYDDATYTFEFIVDNEGKINIDTPITCTFTNKYTKRHTAATPSKPTLNTGDHYAYVMGYPDGTVRPNGSITRAEVSAILFRLLSDKTRDEYFTTESSFTDVKAGAWYNNSIATLEKAGVIVDTAKGGAFRPNEAITRAELAAMLAQFSDAKPVKGVKFSDVSAEHWAYEAIAIAAKMGWIEGYPDGTFRPDATITRAEMMTLVNRALERVPSDEDHLLSKRVMLTFPDCKSGDWFYIAVQEATNSHTYERAATEKNGDEQWTALRANRDWTLLEK